MNGNMLPNYQLHAIADHLFDISIAHWASVYINLNSFSYKNR